ncbi:alkyl hydroperoxide reductase subunit F [Mangrovibacterium marinum]|uniref:Alkyl hydroperoxide reductase subunit F n=1 Tax=Mangrovibacterium marinum TaxID=1639118 RepID=A0A2T5C4M2_9BACT|nr:alkyl hydroperoxide reductase subunit F [Mangrovibacterium marinum]PTN09822.1 alkyl hydroperoxide reductase subunit F [Mangrovibacterium marinum]
MLDQALKDQVKGIFAGLQNKYTFLISVVPNHPSKAEIRSLLDDVASCSEKLDVQETEGDALSFSILKNGEASRFVFRAVPTGHEFTTLLLAILNQDGIGKNLPDALMADRIKGIHKPIHLKSYISLSCTNCPDVVQALNILSILNPNIQHEIIDGGINKAEAEQLNIQAVPTVYANGEQLHVGRSSLGELLGKIEALSGTEFNTAAAPAKNYDVIVAGGGPAGVSAAIYSARKGFSVALVAEKVGGQVTETVDIENMISVPKTTGSQLSANLKLHLDDYKIDVLENRRVIDIELVDGVKNIETSLGEKLAAPALIIATGASWRKLNVPGESQYIGSGVAFCTHCDGPFYKGKRVAVVGGGNSGLEAAIDLSSIASEVTVLEFMDTLKGDQVLQKKIEGLPNVKVITSAQTLEVLGDGNKVIGMNFKHRNDERIEKLELDGVFVQIGLTANSGVFADLVETNRMGEILIDANCRTSQPGIYAAGDVSQVPYKQIVIAMGEGSKAALSAFDDNIKGVQLGVVDEALANA